MRKTKFKDIVQISIVAALYVVLTIVIQPIAYQELQFRLSEVLMLLVFYNRKYSISMIIGCLIANLASPYLLWDMIFGTTATALACLAIAFSKNLLLASIWPAIFNGLIVGAEIAILDKLPYFACVLSVAIGEFVVVTLLGSVVFKLITANKQIYGLLTDKEMD